MMNTILTPEELAWAFGPDYGGYSRRQSPQLWNDLHSDLFTIHGSDEVSITERKIKEEYKKQAHISQPQPVIKTSKD